MQRLFSKMENRKPWRQQSGGHPQHVEEAWLAVRGAHVSALHSPIQSARKVLRVRRARRALVQWKELCYVASEAHFEGDASK